MMKHLCDLLTKHRNFFLVTLLAATLAVSTAANQERLRASSVTVDIPVAAASASVLTPFESFRKQREDAVRSDIAALEQLIAQPALDEQTRCDAAERLTAIIEDRQAETALEGALLNSSLSPCVAVIAGDALTIVTGKTSLTDKDSAIVLTLAAAHTAVQPHNIRIITAE